MKKFRRPRQPKPRRGASSYAWIAGLAAALAALLGACGGSGPADSGPPADSAALRTAAAGDLAGVVQHTLRQREQARSANGSLLSAGDAILTVAAPGATAGAQTSRSTTLVQEANVDEADLLKSDGRHFYSLRSESTPGGYALRLLSDRRNADGSLTPIGSLQLGADGAAGFETEGMLLAADGQSGAVITQRWLQVVVGPDCFAGCLPTPGLMPVPLWTKSSVGVQRVQFSGGMPEASTRLDIDGILVSTRLSGNRLVVVSVHRPRLALDELAVTAPAAQREAAIAGVTAAEVLPTVRVNGGASQPLVEETDCWVQTANASLAVEVTTITVIDMASPVFARTSHCFVGGTEAMFMTPETLYLATTRFMYQATSQGWIYPTDTRTDIHKFALGNAVAYRGSGSVAGHLGWDAQRKSYRLSEFGGDLRVLSYTGDRGWATLADARNAGIAPSPALLTVLREHAGSARLETVATLPNAARPDPLGKPGEQVHGVRFIGTRGYLVTFRVVDPLYVLDLADTADPKVTAALEVPGVSDHLVPVGDGLLLGVGHDVSRQGALAGVKISLLDVRDAARPVELAALSFGARGSLSGLEVARHGINLLERNGTMHVALPLAAYDDSTFKWTQGVHKFEVDLAARTLRSVGVAGAQTSDTYPELWTERNLQADDDVYDLRRGELARYRW